MVELAEEGGTGQNQRSHGGKCPDVTTHRRAGRGTGPAGEHPPEDCPEPGHDRNDDQASGLGGRDCHHRDVADRYRPEDDAGCCSKQEPRKSDAIAGRHCPNINVVRDAVG
ncbi:hypothetical protein GCM10022222_84870 [Amycolatopsis ultiminotia]|uniref:Uncharacterized protein n=1 Tax=Amycolatopsis ultiminotia TaxID=543629 RepID=A0ABP6YQ14_9PSEU